jgi:hypothetical protein
VLVLKHLSQLNRATRRALEVKPALRILDFGVYEVQGSKGNWHKVNCRLSGTGQRLVFCSCEEGKPRRTGFTCLHMATAVGAHIMLAMARKAAMMEGINIIYDGDGTGE